VNIQDRNVGNRGDVVKHAALVAIANAMRARTPGPIRHVETHTFRLVAPLVDAAGWAARAAGLDTYAAYEAPWVARGLYRCSAGLAADVLGPPCRLLLAEAHPPTRAALGEALVDEGLSVDALVDDAHALLTLPPGEPAPLLLHVDPFDHPSGYWPVVEHLLARWRRPDQDAAVLAFAYDKRAPIHWPDPPGGLAPLGRLDAAPYGLAAWATPALAAGVCSALTTMSWARD
jgi:23S rRNA A2030 N6-methylase RlmJ